MIKVYTPKAWYALLGNQPCIIIEDDGLIYSEADYYKTLRNPIGKIDGQKGLIYGEDYLKSFPQPIGAIKEKGNVTEIYGPDYLKTFARPILYLRDNRIYSADEFFRLFPQEAGFIRDEGKKETGSITVDSTYADHTNRDVGGEGSGCLLETVFKVIKAAVIILAIGVLMFFMLKYVFVDLLTEDPDLAQMSWGSLAIGATLALCVIPIDFLTAVKKKKMPDCVKHFSLFWWCFLGAILTLWIWDNLDVITGQVKLSTGRVFLNLIAPLGYALVMVIPSAIIGFLLGLLANLIWKILGGKKEQGRTE